MLANANTRPASTNRILVPLIAGVAGIAFYVAVALLLGPVIGKLYDDPGVVFAPAHFNDARQYVYICNQGYDLPLIAPFLTLGRSRLNWMPVYAVLQCALNRGLGVSLIYAGLYVSALATGITIFLGALTLANLGVRRPALHACAVLAPPIGAAWLYLPGVEATYLAVGMAVMWLVTLPARPESPRGQTLELLRALAGLPLGVVFILTKPNALAFAFPLVFAFFYLGWQRSRAAGYSFGLWSYVADVVIEHLRPGLAFLWRLRGRALALEARPVRYDWAPATVTAGIVLGFAYWLAYSSVFSGVPLYFLNQQLNAWGRAWPSGNLGEMLLYFVQAFRPIDPGKHWRYNAAWNLAAHLAALLPAASPRVPILLRGMLVLLVVFVLYTGAVHGSDRYILSTALVAVGWACWLAPAGQRGKWSMLRWTFLLLLAGVTFYLLTWQMFPLGEPNAWGIVDR